MTKLNATLDDSSSRAFEVIKESTPNKSADAALTEALRLKYNVVQQAKQGFSEIVLRNPRTREERTLLIGDADIG